MRLDGSGQGAEATVAPGSSIGSLKRSVDQGDGGEEKGRGGHNQPGQGDFVPAVHVAGAEEVAATA